MVDSKVRSCAHAGCVGVRAVSARRNAREGSSCRERDGMAVFVSRRSWRGLVSTCACQGARKGAALGRSMSVCAGHGHGKAMAWPRRLRCRCTTTAAAGWKQLRDGLLQKKGTGWSYGLATRGFIGGAQHTGSTKGLGRRAAAAYLVDLGKKGGGVGSSRGSGALVRCRATHERRGHRTGR